ncbi:DUF4175 domain-containing protein [Micavibrio aeruginosavorus]|uniref:Uncharacterized protein n=1 Tax=Micavibrio aeruginosavorus EPB TaxID=349215 RepID=M4VFN6_9BACT|nr:DUF4175 family protein [Micavibrio aeruginosavorus]AGH98187.1 hypothetical protein A11S_1378 [Micavibrio aeruginosavorus EPB]
MTHTPRHDEQQDPSRRPMTLSARLGFLRALSAWIITAERGTASIWRIIVWIMAFAGLWMLQIPQIFGMAGSVIALIIFVVGLIYIPWRYSPRFQMPRASDIDRRLEIDSDLSHRPLSQSHDRLANPQKDDTRRLWDVARGQQQKLLARLRVPRPRPVLAPADPMALRILVALVVICGLAIAGPSWHARVHDGLVPFSWPKAVAKADTITVWITPPAYTGVPEMVFSEKTKFDPAKPIAVPMGSDIKVRVRSNWHNLGGDIAAPVLAADGQSFAMDNLGDGNYGLVRPFPQANHFRIRQLVFNRMEWMATIIPDTPPTITIAGESDIGPHADVKIPVKLHDDYGVETLDMTVTLAADAESVPLGADYTATQTIMSPPGQDYETAPSFDLAWHPWAGLPVQITMTATDHRGQTASLSEPVTITLPERTFRHPLARQLVTMRKRLIRTPDEAASNVAYDLETIVMSPSTYQGDPVIFLALRSAAVRLLTYPGNRDEMAAVVALLWDVALRVEDGNMTMAYRGLKDAQQALQNALRDPTTTPEQLAQLVEELRQAMAEYMQEMVREMQKNMDQSGAEQLMTAEALEQAMNTMDLSAYIDQMMARAMSGDRNAAQQMLNDLQKMMESMDPSADMQLPEDVKKMMESLGGLQDIIEQQEKLLAATKEAKTDEAETAAEKSTQDSIRNDMGELMIKMDEALGQIPEKIGEAEQFMRKSADELATNNPGGSIPHQEDALDRLRNQQKQMSEKLQQRLQQMTMLSFGGGGMRTDPLGRPIEDGDGGQNPWSKSKVEVPDEAERRRIYDIMQELRKKSGELTRPDYELDYFHRLMRQF